MNTCTHARTPTENAKTLIMKVKILPLSNSVKFNLTSVFSIFWSNKICECSVEMHFYFQFSVRNSVFVFFLRIKLLFFFVCVCEYYFIRRNSTRTIVKKPFKFSYWNAHFEPTFVSTYVVQNITSDIHSQQQCFAHNKFLTTDNTALGTARTPITATRVS